MIYNARGSCRERLQTKEFLLCFYVHVFELQRCRFCACILIHCYSFITCLFYVVPCFPSISSLAESAIIYFILLRRLFLSDWFFFFTSRITVIVIYPKTVSHIYKLVLIGYNKTLVLKLELISPCILVSELWNKFVFESCDACTFIYLFIFSTCE